MNEHRQPGWPAAVALVLAGFAPLYLLALMEWFA